MIGRPPGEPKVRIFKLTEQAILAALIDPEYFGKTMEKKRQATAKHLSTRKPVSKAIWMKTLKDEWFRNQVAEITIRGIAEHLPEVLSAALVMAKTPTREGFQDRRMILEMAGLYQHHQSVSIGGSVDHQHQHEMGDRVVASQKRAMDSIARMANGEDEIVPPQGTQVH